MRNYHRFYASLQRICVGDADDMKETLVSSFTEGRTTHLHEMTDAEYAAMCASLEERCGWKSELKKKRSVCLKLMQQLGVDTTDWGRVNAFCSNPRISGRVFAKLGVKDLDALQLKLRAIKRNGGLGRRAALGGVGSAAVDSLPVGETAGNSGYLSPAAGYFMLPIGEGGEA